MDLTYKQKFNQRYGFPLGASHSIEEISKYTGYSEAGLKIIYQKGLGAFYSNHSAVRPQVKSADQWAQARIYSAVMGGKAARVDAAHLIKK